VSGCGYPGVRACMHVRRLCVSSGTATLYILSRTMLVQCGTCLVMLNPRHRNGDLDVTIPTLCLLRGGVGVATDSSVRGTTSEWEEVWVVRHFLRWEDGAAVECAWRLVQRSGQL
jgi:hypothetical protein